MKVVSYYRRLLKALGVSVKDNTIVKYDGTPVLVNGLELKLPTEDNLTNQTRIENGKTVDNYYIFNPIKENAIRGNGISFNWLKRTIETKASYLFTYITIAKLEVASRYGKTAATDPIINSLVTSLLGAKSKGSKKFITERTLEEVDKLLDMLKEYRIFKYYVTKKKIDGKVTAITSVTSPLYTKLTSEEFKDEVKANKISMQSYKMLIVLTKDLLEYLDMVDNNLVIRTTKPYGRYLTFIEAVKKTLSALQANLDRYVKLIDEDEYKQLSIDISALIVDPEELEDELFRLPQDTTEDSVADKPITHRKPVNTGIITDTTITAPVLEDNVEEDSDNSNSNEEQVYYINGIPMKSSGDIQPNVIPPIQGQQPITPNYALPNIATQPIVQQTVGQPTGMYTMGMQPMMGQPVMGQPMGMQPMMGQPMMGQPMMGSPLTQYSTGTTTTTAKTVHKPSSFGF